MSDIVFIPLTKVDLAKREVWGVVAEEAPDKTGEIMDYESSKPHFTAWSEQISKASGGKSLGNVRAMHAPVAVGKLLRLDARDDEKKICVGAKVVDEDAWEKVLEGVYTGFSVGGRYGKRWPDPENTELMRYEAIPVEVSLVDNPAMYGATFEVIKAEGEPELRKFTGQQPTPVVQAWNAEQGTVREVLPDALIVEHDGGLYRAAYQANDDGFTFEDLVKVTVQYVLVEGEPEPDELQKVAADLQKAFQEQIDGLVKRVAGIEETVGDTQNTDLVRGMLDALDKRLTALETQPAADPPVVRQVPGSEHLVPPQEETPEALSIDELRRMAANEPNPLLKAEYNRKVLLAELQLGH